MKTLDAIYQRRSIKKFDPAFKISADDEKKLFEAAQQAPSSFNIQHWRFIDVKDLELKKQLREASYNQSQITDASLVLVLCADLKAHDKEPERYWATAPEQIRNKIVSTIKSYYTEDHQAARDEAMRSVGLIAQTLMLAAKGMGYDSSAMVGFEYDKVAKLINLPQDHVIGMIIAIGKAAEPAFPKGGMLPLDEVIKVNKF